MNIFEDDIIEGGDGVIVSWFIVLSFILLVVGIAVVVVVDVDMDVAGSVGGGVVVVVVVVVVGSCRGFLSGVWE